MSYNKHTWVNNVDAVDEDKMNHIENGIANATDVGIANATDIVEIKSDISNLQNNVFNVTETSANVNTSTIGHIDVNKVVVCGRIVHVVFRGYVQNNHVNNTPLLQLPDGISSQIGSSESFAFGIGGQYDISSQAWGYLNGSSLNATAVVKADSWVHINLTFIKE